MAKQEKHSFIDFFSWRRNDELFPLCHLHYDGLYLEREWIETGQTSHDWFLVRLQICKTTEILDLLQVSFSDLSRNEGKPSGDSRKAVYSIAAKSLDRAICVHFSYHRLHTVASSIP